jgi:tRNA(fMet)-specific endonuclease VapC
MKYMLDTNICIYLIRKKPENLIEKLKSLHIGDICISSVTLAELRYGVEKSQHQEKNRFALEEFILPIEVMPFDDDAASYYGCLRALLEKKGTPIGSLDLMIGANALSLNSILVTNNTREFFRIPNLTVEDWVNSI